MEVKVRLNHLHIAPRKVRLIADTIKGMRLDRAERELSHRVKRASRPLLKLLRSAAADASHNFHIAEEGLVIKSIRVDPGQVRTKYRPRAFGRAAPIRRRTSHVVLTMESVGSAPEPAIKRATPAVREAALEDLRGQELKRPARAASEKDRPRPKSPGFIRRIFQRKAI